MKAMTFFLGWVIWFCVIAIGMADVFGWNVFYSACWGAGVGWVIFWCAFSSDIYDDVGGM